ncbi:hypothetical protein MXE87_03800 [Enterococcus faecium]|uniref:Uncharacterized protein n=1 Tax=Enterococcus lactis TaxID=357441 RepID=A0AAJ1SMV0_9ENTE|nr:MULTISPECIES: hypothetical protein [Enterococcus]MDP8584469.1 hypothetical protein [Listeria innocua]MDP8590880.1 hypothetical protein [Enterococcus lactis]MEB6143549.1 hypothetical protein [Enterococcus faecium]ROW78746.1 hypothetical protein EGW24_03335 [Enterococcus faecium]
MNNLSKLKDLQFIISTVNEALMKEANNAAIFCSLAIPDLCGQIEYPKIKSVKKRYSKWYDEYIYKYENPRTTTDKINQIDGDVIYLLRCKLFHETSQYHAEVLNKIKKKYARRSNIKEENVNLKLNFDSEVNKIQVTGGSWKPNEINVLIEMNQVLLARKLVQTAQGYYNKKMK